MAELIDLTPAEVRGTASFYEMFHLQPVGRYLVAVCTNIACMLAGAYELLEHMELRLGVSLGGTSDDGMFTLEDTECLALCGNAPCLVVNWRYFGDMTPDRWDTLSADLAEGRLGDEVPPHGTLCRVRRAVGLPAAGGKVAQAAKAAGAADTKAGNVRAGQARLSGEPPVARSLPATGQWCNLATSRTTAAVASTLDPGGGIEARRRAAK